MNRKTEIEKRMGEIAELLAGETEVNIDELETEVRSLKNELKEIEARSKREQMAADLQSGVLQARQIEKPEGEIKLFTTDSQEYRNAFKEFVLEGKSSDVLKRATTFTSDVGTVIPQTIINRIVEKMRSYGQIFSRITMSNVKGGVSIPTSNLKPVATWTNEGETSAKQKKTTGQVTFSYHKLQCRVAVTLEADTVSMDIFESALVDNIYEAMIVALESSIVSGTGVKQPLGITVDPKVDNSTTVTAANLSKYTTWTDIISKIPLSSEGRVVLTMTKRDWDKNIVGMVDSAGQPVARTDYGIEGRPQRRFLGYEVVLVEGYLKDHATAVVGDTFAFFADYKDFILNSNLQYTYKKYFDEETDEFVHKTTLIADGKLADGQNVLLIKKA